jgi:plastocyanin domain-containing protein
LQQPPQQQQQQHYQTINKYAVQPTASQLQQQQQSQLSIDPYGFNQPQQQPQHSVHSTYTTRHVHHQHGVPQGSPSLNNSNEYG